MSDRVSGRESTFSVLVGLGALCALIVLSCSYLTTEMTYDEAVYLGLARSIAETGLPLRHTVEKLDEYYLFQNSPPLVMYVASLTQRLTPGSELLSRVVHLGLFTIPTFGVVWWVTLRRFGGWPSVLAMALLFGSGSFIGSSHFVQLDVPVGLLSVLCLVAFDRAHVADGRERRWAVAAGALLFLATWTKYYAICTAAAVSGYCLWCVVTRQRKGLWKPLLAVFCGGLLAVASLYVFFQAFGADVLEQTLEYNSERMRFAPDGAVRAVRAALATGGDSVRYVGAPLLVLALCSPLLPGRHGRLVLLLWFYVLAGLGFNLIFHGLPGAGGYYLNALVPTLAILAGATGSAISTVWEPRTKVAAAAGVVVVTQIVGAFPPIYLPPYDNPAKRAAEMIGTNGDFAVLANTYAIEFYTGHPVRVITFSRPQLLLDSLAGTSRERVEYVVIDRHGLPPGTETIALEWQRLLSEHFVLLGVDNPRLAVYRRKGPGIE